MRVRSLIWTAGVLLLGCSTDPSAVLIVTVTDAFLSGSEPDSIHVFYRIENPSSISLSVQQCSGHVHGVLEIRSSERWAFVGTIACDPLANEAPLRLDPGVSVADELHLSPVGPGRFRLRVGYVEEPRSPWLGDAYSAFSPEFALP